MNLSNRNAALLLDFLGFRKDDDELMGSIPVDEILAAEQLYGLHPLAEIRDKGIPTTKTGGDGSAVMVDVGLDPGYLAGRASQLVKLAIGAKSHGYSVVTYA